MQHIESYRMEQDEKHHPVLVTESIFEYESALVNTPEKVVDLFNRVARLKYMAEEQVWLMATDTAGYVIGLFMVSQGSVNSTVCNPREIFLRALAIGAVSVIVAHNHPSGRCEPSNDDRQCCSRLVKAGKILGITVNDFIIIAGDTYCSFCEEKELK